MKHLLIIFSLLAFITPAHAHSSKTHGVCKPMVLLDGSVRFEEEMNKCKEGQIIRLLVKKSWVDPATLSAGYCMFD